MTPHPRLPGHQTFVIDDAANVLHTCPDTPGDTLWTAAPVGVRDHSRFRTGVARAIEHDIDVTVARLEVAAGGQERVWQARVGPAGPKRYIVELVDITSSIESAMRAQQEGSLYLLGQFAHQIRNPLAGITGAIQVFGIELEPDDPKAEVMEMVLEESFRLNRLISDLVTLSRDPDVQREPVDVREVVDALREAMATSHADADVAVEGTATWTTDRAHLERILRELLNNGAEAAGEHGQVIVRIEPNAVSISDSGPGVEPANVDRIYEPLFSTRGRGMGLGLAIARRLATLLGFTLRAAPPSDLTGATFVLQQRVDSPF